MSNKTIWILFLVPVLYSCKDKYNPPDIDLPNPLLVVEGYLNAGGLTTVHLSRTFKLNAANRPVPETGAQVRVEGSNSTFYNLIPKPNGVYEIANLPLNPGQKYRLHIFAKSKQYVSDFVEVKLTPPIDTVNWKRERDGVQIYVNTHDPQNKTVYYLWNYDETWEFNSIYPSNKEYKNNKVVDRDPNVNIFTCWKSQSSTNVFVGSSAKLSSDVISLMPIRLIPNFSWMLSVKYSILVRQYALTEQGYKYWQNIKKNTEQLGSIFDVQPSEIRGNLRCLTDTNEIVIGHISAGRIMEQRIFINPKDVPSWTSINYATDCTLDTTKLDSIRYWFQDGQYIPITESYDAFGNFLYPFARNICVDCRLTGSNVRPPFWR